MRNSKKITKCRLCKSKKLYQILGFGKVPLGNNLLSSRKLANEVKTFNLSLIRCKICGHFQLSDEVAPELLYATNYTYLSGVASSFVEHFENYTTWVIKQCKLKKKDLVLDVGSNDGTCLNSFKKRNLNVLGIDPAYLPAKIANNNGINTINKFFNSKSSIEIKENFGQVDFITSHNVLAHIGNITEVFENIFDLLKDDGYFCFEVGYFLKVLQNNFFDTIYHEHLDYHHASPLIKYLSNLGFSIINISTNKIQGGSIRILCKKKNKTKIYSQPKKFLQKEKNSIINDKRYISSWANSIYININKFKNLIKDYKNQKKIIIGYGAPTKATLILKISGVRYNTIAEIVEDNDLKVGRYLPKTDIKICKYNKLKINKSEVIIIFAWNFFSDIINKLKKDKIKNKVIISPLPEVKVYNL